MGVHEINPCASAFNVDDHLRKIQGNRKAIMVEMFFTYLIYLGLILYGAMKHNYPPKSNTISSNFLIRICFKQVAEKFMHSKT